MRLRDLLVWFESIVLVYFLFVNSFYLLLLVSASRELRWYRSAAWGERRRELLDSRVAPSVSLLAPAYNEAATIVESTRSMLALDYANLEVIVVNDGSADETLEVLVREFGLVSVNPIFRRRAAHAEVRSVWRSVIHRNLVVVDKVNGGKSDALNAALNIASGELVCAIDADTLIETDAIQRMVRAFLFDDAVVAAGGTIRVANGSIVQHGRVVEARTPRHLLPGVQTVEYLRAFLFGRLGWNRLGGNLIISGAFGLFDRAAVLEAGGYRHGTVGEDMELVFELRRRGYERGERRKVVFVPDPVAWTEAPDRVRVLSRQRDRWHRGLAEGVRANRRVLLNPRYGVLGLVVFPYFVFVELLAPVVELAGLIVLVIALAPGNVDVAFAVLFWAVAYGLGLVLSVATILMDEIVYHRTTRLSDRLLLVLWALIEPFGYRQATVVWRLRGLWNFLRGRGHWGTMERSGFAVASTSNEGQ